MTCKRCAEEAQLIQQYRDARFALDAAQQVVADAETLSQDAWRALSKFQNDRVNEECGQ
jgi:hypothetical protein